MKMNKVKTAVKLGQLDEFVNIILRLFDEFKDGLNDLFLNKQMAILLEKSIQFNLAIKRDKIVSKLDSLDSERIYALRSLYKLLDGYCFLPFENEKECAVYLKGIYSKYRATILKEDNLTQSSSIKSLLNDLNTDEAREKIEKLGGISEIIENIKVAQTNFDTARDEYTSAKNDRTANASELKKDILVLVNDTIRSYIKAVSKEENYFEFAKKFKNEIDELNGKLKK